VVVVVMVVVVVAAAAAVAAVVIRNEWNNVKIYFAKCKVLCYLLHNSQPNGSSRLKKVINSMH